MLPSASKVCRPDCGRARRPRSSDPENFEMAAWLVRECVSAGRAGRGRGEICACCLVRHRHHGRTCGAGGSALSGSLVEPCVLINPFVVFERDRPPQPSPQWQPKTASTIDQTFLDALSCVLGLQSADCVSVSLVPDVAHLALYRLGVLRPYPLQAFLTLRTA